MDDSRDLQTAFSTKELQKLQSQSDSFHNQKQDLKTQLEQTVVTKQDKAVQKEPETARESQ